MLPAGKITEATIEALSKLMEHGDVIIDGGNTFWQDDVRRGKALKERGIHYVDVGTSGGVWGIERGYCMMIGGDKAVVDRLDPIFKTLAPGIGDIDAHQGPRGTRSPDRTGLHPRRPGRRRPFRQDGPQRHRIRPDAGLCRRFRHPEERQYRRAAGGASLRSRHCRHRRGLAARQRDPVMAARSHRVGAREEPHAG